MNPTITRNDIPVAFSPATLGKAHAYRNAISVAQKVRGYVASLCADGVLQRWQG